MKNKTNKINSGYPLGSFPWKEEDLRKAYFSNFLKTQKTIERHPGFLAHQTLESIRLSLDIFLYSVSDLMKSIDLFTKESEVVEFWTRSRQEQFNKLEFSIIRGVFYTAASAMALVDNCRQINEKFKPSDYQLRIDSIFGNNEEHRFIQDFRNFVSHVKMIEVNWKVSWLKEGKHTQFLLHPKKLLYWDGWTPLAEGFIKQHTQGIDIKILFENYERRVKEFHHWFHTEIERLSQPDLSEYRRYKRLLNKFEIKSFWNVAFQQVISQKIDPYKYLDQYLTKSELDEVLLLPRNSQIQVDKIIEILDEYEVCDEELMRAIYVAFNVDNWSK